MPATSQVQQKSEPGWLSQAAAADHIGVSVQTLRGYIAQGILPAYRVKGQRRIRLRKADLDAVMERIPTTDGPSAG